MDWMMYLKVFLVGGALCAIGQALIDYTKLTPARILVSYVVTGVILGGLGIQRTPTAQGTATSAGIAAAVIFGLIFALIFKPKDKS